MLNWLHGFDIKYISNGWPGACERPHLACSSWGDPEVVAVAVMLMGWRWEHVSMNQQPHSHRCRLECSSSMSQWPAGPLHSALRPAQPPPPPEGHSPEFILIFNFCHISDFYATHTKLLPLVSVRQSELWHIRSCMESNKGDLCKMKNRFVRFSCITVLHTLCNNSVWLDLMCVVI